MEKKNIVVYPGFVEAEGFTSRKSLIDELLEQNALTDSAQSSKIAKNASAISKNEKADAVRTKNIATNKTNISANKTAIAKNDANDVKQAEEIAKLGKDLTSEISRAKKAEGELNDAISAEVTRATEAEGVLDGKISDEVSRATEAEGELDTKISDETTRATAAEEKLTSDLNTEVERAIGVENTLNSNLVTLNNNVLEISQTLVTAIQNEAARATAAEEKLTSDLNAEISRATEAEEGLANDLNAEVERATAAEEILTNDVNSISGVLDTLLNSKGVDEVIDTFKDVEDFLNGISDSETLTVLVKNAVDAEETRATAAEEELSSAISAEESRAIEEEGVLDGKISDEVSRASKAEEDLANAISAEESRATLAETELDAALKNEALERKTDVLSLNNTISSQVSTLNNSIASVNIALANEISRATAKENEIGSSVSDEISRATAAEGVLDGKIDAEKSRAMGVEATLNSNLVSLNDNVLAISQTLTTAIQNEGSRATSAESVLDGKISDEVSRAEVKEGELSNAISAEETRATSAEGVLDGKISTINETLDTLLNTKGVDEVIDTFKDVEDFLNGISDSKTLTELVMNAVDAEETRATAAEGVLDGKIDAEKSRAEAKEGELSSAIDTAKSELTTAIATAKSEAIAAATYDDTEVKGLIADNASAIETMDSAYKAADSALNARIEVLEGIDHDAYKVADETLKTELTTAIATAKSEAIAAATYDDTEVKGLIADNKVAIEAIVIPTKVSAFENDANYLTEHQSLADYAKSVDVADTYQVKGDYALKSEIPSLDGYATESWVEGKNYLTEHQSLADYALKSEVPSIEGLATEEMVKSNTNAIEGLNVALNALKDAIASQIKSEVVIGEKLIDGEFNYAPENGDLYIVNSEVSGDKGSSHGKVMFDATSVKVSNVSVHDATGTYNVFEQGQTTKPIETMEISNLSVDGGLQHNIINLYNFADNAVITLKDVVVTDSTPSKTNLMRVSNYNNATGVTINFENVSVDYAEGTDMSDYAYFGFLLYQAVNNKDASTGSTSCVDTWTVNFKNCYLNGNKIESLNFGTVDQVAYTYNFGGNGGVTSIDDVSKSNMKVNFE